MMLKAAVCPSLLDQASHRKSSFEEILCNSLARRQMLSAISPEEFAQVIGKALTDDDEELID